MPLQSLPTARRLPLLVTADTDLLDDLLRLAAAGGCELEVAPDPAAARPRYPAAPLVLIGTDQAPAALRAALPRRPRVVLVGRSSGYSDDPWQLAEALGAEHVAMLPTAEAWLVDRFAERLPSLGHGRVVARARRPGRRRRERAGRRAGRHGAAGRPAHAAGRRRPARRRARPGARLGGPRRAALAGARPGRRPGRRGRRSWAPCRTAATWCALVRTGASCAGLPPEAMAADAGRRPARPRPGGRRPAAPASTTRRWWRCRRPTASASWCRPSCGPRAAAGRVAALTAPALRRRGAWSCAARRRAGSGPRESPVARPAAGRHPAPRAGVSRSLERGEAPASTGRGPLAALCQRLVGDLTGTPGEAAA